MVKKAAGKENGIQESVAVQPASSQLTVKPSFFIAGIGASAGGLEALKLFFDQTRPDGGMAYVIVQHLDPTHKSLLSDLLSGHTKMPVKQIRNGVKVKPNCVYVIPPNKDLIISNQKLLLIELPDNRRNRRPIDSFFHSLADDQKENAIGIVLSGTGTEGTLGLKEIKANGGMSIVQDPATAQFDGMPQSAINAKVADYILPPEKMPEKLLDYIKERASSNREGTDELPGLSEGKFNKIFQIIRSQTGHDFSNYKTNTIARRINKRMVFNKINSVEGYFDFLEKNAAEVKNLSKDFLIGVTSFFRDKDVFKSLEKKVIPYLVEKCAGKQEIRIWVCACSTGEEAYSIAILFKEALENSRQHIKVSIFASDIDNVTIDFARAAVYGERAVAGISSDRLLKYFTQSGKGYQLKKEIREMVVFAHHNLIKDPPFSKMDLITCRNLLIYLKSELQKKIIPLFHYSLNNDGILILGTSETIGDFGNLFSSFDEKNKIYKAKILNNRKFNPIYELPFVVQKTDIKERAQAAAAKITINKSPDHDKILPGNYALPFVIIDKNNDSLYFSGNTGLYLNHPSGVAKWNILELVKKGFRPDLENAIRKARKNKVEVKKARH
jgi:two-component system CheB/CheR fusion protein